MKNRHYVDVIVLWVFLLTALSLSWGDRTVTGLLIAKGDPIPQGFGAPYDVGPFSSGDTSPYIGKQIIDAKYENSQILVAVSNTEWVWSIGYYYDYTAGQWKSFTFAGTQNSGWIQNVASAGVAPTGLRQGTNYAIAYTCRQASGQWKCGCRDTATCGLWQIQSFDVSSPPPPPPPAGACGNGIVDVGEDCDGTNLDGKTCQTQGFTGGTLRCYAAGTTNQCRFDTSSCTGTASALGITTQSLPAATAGQAYTQYADASGGTTPYTWSVAGGSLPSGMSLTTENNRGKITGTPTASGSFDFTATVTDSSATQQSASKQFTITVNAASGGIIVRARSDIAQNIGAHFVVKANGNTIGSATASTSAYADYGFAFSGTVSSLSIIFDNDYYNPGVEDRNLLIDYVIATGQKYEAETSFSYFVNNQPIPRADYVRGTEVVMATNGELVLNQQQTSSCAITSAAWSTTSASANQQISTIANTQNCVGTQYTIDFNVKKSATGESARSNPVTYTFDQNSNNQASGTWIAESTGSNDVYVFDAVLKNTARSTVQTVRSTNSLTVGGSGGSCTSNSQCPSGQVCDPWGACQVAQCTSGQTRSCTATLPGTTTTCTGTESCINGIWDNSCNVGNCYIQEGVYCAISDSCSKTYEEYRACTSNSQCLSGQTCQSGVCKPGRTLYCRSIESSGAKFIHQSSVPTTEYFFGCDGSYVLGTCPGGQICITPGKTQQQIIAEGIGCNANEQKTTDIDGGYSCWYVSTSSPQWGWRTLDAIAAVCTTTSCSTLQLAGTGGSIAYCSKNTCPAGTPAATIGSCFKYSEQEARCTSGGSQSMLFYVGPSYVYRGQSLTYSVSGASANADVKLYCQYGGTEQCGGFIMCTTNSQGSCSWTATIQNSVSTGSWTAYVTVGNAQSNSASFTVA